MFIFLFLSIYIQEFYPWPRMVKICVNFRLIWSFCLHNIVVYFLKRNVNNIMTPTQFGIFCCCWSVICSFIICSFLVTSKFHPSSWILISIRLILFIYIVIDECEPNCVMYKTTCCLPRDLPFCVKTLWIVQNFNSSKSYFPDTRTY